MIHFTLELVVSWSFIIWLMAISFQATAHIVSKLQVDNLSFLYLYKCIFTVNYKVLLNFTYFNFGEKTVASSTGYSINKHIAKG